ncbi:MAG: hypothetical protein Kow0037_25640 [Calditrichia bacterium]
MAVQSRAKRLFGYGFQLQRKIREYLVGEKSQFASLRQEFYRKLWLETAGQLNVPIEELEKGIYRVFVNDRQIFVMGGFVPLDDFLILKIAGNKPLSLQLLSELGVPVPRHVVFDYFSRKKAEIFLKNINKPIVIKPADSGSAGGGVFTGITSPAQLKQAAREASAHSQRLLAEEQIPGNSYRLLYLDGEFIDAIRRDPPAITGNGKYSIKRLIGEENQLRLKEGDRAMHPISIDRELKQFLKERGLSITNIPETNQKIVLKRVVNQNNRFQNHSVREMVHPTTIEMGQKIVRSLGIRLAGIDLQSTDISLPLDESRGVVNEINTTPGLHHHYLIAEKDKIIPVAKLILERLIKLSEKQSREYLNESEQFKT